MIPVDLPLHELWSDVGVFPFADFYSVSTAGRLESKPRQITDINGVQRTYQGGPMTPFYKPPYFYVELSSAGYTKKYAVHQLVALTFLEPKPSPVHEVRHLDCNPINNSLENLAWGTKQENAQDTLVAGRNHRTSQTRCSNGHLFIGLNLIRQKPYMHRKCRSCARAWGIVNKARARNKPEPDFSSLADAYYRGFCERDSELAALEMVVS